ncbi:MAG: hypothetical protein ACYYK0_00950 [Candidatus Eutrophobiaceae bacterium]
MFEIDGEFDEKKRKSLFTAFVRMGKKRKYLFLRKNFGAMALAAAEIGNSFSIQMQSFKFRFFYSDLSLSQGRAKGL